MPSWWGKSSSKDVKKDTNKESFIDAIRRFKIFSIEEKWNNRSKGSKKRTNISQKISQSVAESRSTSPSNQVSRCQSFAERPQAQPLPLPRVHVNCMQPDDVSRKQRLRPISPLPPKVGRTHDGSYIIDVETLSESSVDSDEPSSRLPSPQASDYEYGSKTALNSPLSAKDKDHFTVATRQKPTHRSKKPNILSSNSQTVPASPKRGPLRSHVSNIQIPAHGAFCSAPDSSRSSPSRSPLRSFYPDFWPGKSHIDSGQCSSPGSGQNSGQNSVGGDLTTHVFWQPNNRCSPECSPIPSPRMTSPGPGSRIHSGAVTPRAGDWPDDVKQKTHRLPLPPLSVTRSCPFSSSYSTGTTPSVPRSPGRLENVPSPGSRWKKGRLLGRGTFGQVYLGFNSESGEMCAMKEVTLLSDDAKSKESAQQLEQEIALLSRLRHPNIVRYYGSETVDDKLYIYLEYVSGGSIYKILQDYGQLGEVAIRSYTKQILSGLAFLHAKNTVHRDIKGANILVDPNGCVKLADFGMAKHISGYSCPLSFKGSPYWMAPEVIKNSSGCNLAVDIWSLGCTVLEMATTKPPWSQYEGVAAMFKIGNSRDVPAIPDHLSAEGKDFIRQCLQRNPANRPSAAKLLEHSFVKDAAMCERPVISSLTSLGIGRSRNLLSSDSDRVAMYHSRGQRIGSESSEGHTARTCPVSPIGSPLLQARSPHQRSGRLSPSHSLVSSPQTMSASSTPLTGGPPGSIPLFYRNHPHNLYYQHDIFRGMPQPSSLFRDPAEANFLVNSSNQDPRELSYDGQAVLANRVSHQLLKDPSQILRSQPY